MVIAMLVVLKAGGVFAPLDSEHPTGRQEEIFFASKSYGSACLGAAFTLCEHEGNILVTISAASIHKLPGKASEVEVIRSKARPSNTAYGIFTSGTIDVQGVVIKHKCFATGTEYQTDMLGFSKTRRLFDFASYSYAVAVHNGLEVLVTGG